jgi:integrase
MVSYRSAEAQAAHAVGKASAIGQVRHDSRTDGKIHSHGTARSYGQALRGFAAWRSEQGFRGDLQQATTAEARAYLGERAGEVSQKTLDLDRQSMSILPRVEPKDLDRTVSAVDSRTGLGEAPRAYTAEQAQIIAAAQSPQHALATEIAAAAGVRAHELLTLRPADERPASDHREFRDDRFTGRSDVAVYTVEGKGGLVREVAVPADLAQRLEATRLAQARTVTDRGVKYEQHYAISGGQKWSQDFGKHSKEERGWSTGAHGLRHGYAQDRIEELQRIGYTMDDAREVVSQELGHFRGDVTNTYLR